MNTLELVIPGGNMTIVWNDNPAKYYGLDAKIEVDDFVNLISRSTKFRAKVVSIEGEGYVARITDCPIIDKEGKSITFERKNVDCLEKKHNGI